LVNDSEGRGSVINDGVRSSGASNVVATISSNKGDSDSVTVSRSRSEVVRPGDTRASISSNSTSVIVDPVLELGVSSGVRTRDGDRLGLRADGWGNVVNDRKSSSGGSSITTSISNGEGHSGSGGTSRRNSWGVVGPGESGSRTDISGNSSSVAGEPVAVLSIDISRSTLNVSALGLGRDGWTSIVFDDECTVGEDTVSTSITGSESDSDRFSASRSEGSFDVVVRPRSNATVISGLSVTIGAQPSVELVDVRSSGGTRNRWTGSLGGDGWRNIIKGRVGRSGSGFRGSGTARVSGNEGHSDGCTVEWGVNIIVSPDNTMTIGGLSPSSGSSP